MTDTPHQLREQCERLRRTSAPVSEVIPLMQLAADEIDRLRVQLGEAHQLLRRGLVLSRMRELVEGPTHD